MSISSPGLSHYDHPAPEQAAAGGSLVIAVWSRDRRILDEFVLAAREFYVSSRILPRRQLNPNGEPSGALLTARFEQSDVTYDWMLEYLRSSNALKDVMDYDVSTKQSNLGWGTGPKDSVRYMPSPNSLQRFLFTSPKTGRSTWLQVNIHTGIPSWESNRMIGGTIMITLHSSDRDVLEDLIDCAKEKYLEHGTSRVTVHLTDNLGRWAKTVTKSRRALSTLILPTNIKETILADAREFLASEKWYNLAGIPHRRGYLLYGAPGTGKSSTIHAVAGELGLEIYFISLASPGIDDFTLGQLISDTPSRCILLLEDIDCAFPSREDADEEDEEPEKDRNGNPVHPHEKLVMPPKSAVTLSGLLNVLDSVVSDEGRLTFATTNHIANLDAALIRAGRMDVKIKYGLATTEQIEQVFKVFFPVRGAHTDDEDLPPCTADELAEHASDFAAAIPSETYSIAQIQGYLLTKKQDPLGAVDGVDGWIAEQQAERRALAEQKRKWRAERARWLRGFDVPSRGADAWDRLWSVVEEGNTEDVGGAPAPGDHNGAAPF
ncbi:P-loop containing nucleoside triphosphate hydrolase protein [Mycena latifolia]|nr:P-loop containing nucleoside triphosphate hydrolase protein [Mycena latifolia]